MSESFYLSQLDVDVTSSDATLSGSVSQEFTGDATVNVNVPLSTFKELFQYQTDSTDVADDVADDVKFRSVYSANNLPLGIDINSSAPVVSGSIDTIATNNNVTYDYVRYLALNLFNTHLGVDLFNNEQTLRSSLNDNFKVNLNSVLVALNNEGITDQSGTAPSRTVFNQLIANKPSRFNDITLNKSALVDGKQWYYTPCVIGDKVYFRLTVSPAQDQQKLTAPLSDTVIPNRTYLICANIIADPEPQPAIPTSTIFKYSSGIDVTSTQPTISSVSYLVNGRINTDLVSVIVGTTCTSIATSCFSNCTNLTSIAIPNSVTFLGTNCFISCSKLTSVTIPPLVPALRTGTFANCSTLTSMIIPNTITSIGLSCFSGCTNLISITLPTNTDIKSMSDACFANCSRLTSITIPNSVTSINLDCFFNCSGLTSITIPNLVTSLGQTSFYNCRKLTSFIIPELVTSIGNGCFGSCLGLTSMTIPQSVTNIGPNLFHLCSALTSLIFNDPNTITVDIVSALASVPGPVTITFKKTASYSVLDNNVKVYFPQTPPAIWSYVFIA